MFNLAFSRLDTGIYIANGVRNYFQRRQIKNKQLAFEGDSDHFTHRWVEWKYCLLQLDWSEKVSM